MQWDLSRVVRNTPACAQTRRVAMRLFEEVQPEVDVVLNGIVLNQRQLRPAHRPVEPVAVRHASASTVTSPGDELDGVASTETTKVPPPLRGFLAVFQGN